MTLLFLSLSLSLILLTFTLDFFAILVFNILGLFSLKFFTINLTSNTFSESFNKEYSLFIFLINVSILFLPGSLKSSNKFIPHSTFEPSFISSKIYSFSFVQIKNFSIIVENFSLKSIFSQFFILFEKYSIFFVLSCECVLSIPSTTFVCKVDTQAFLNFNIACSFILHSSITSIGNFIFNKGSCKNWM